jgi:hypothetical protein
LLSRTVSDGGVARGTPKPACGQLMFTTAEWSAFTAEVGDGEFDRSPMGSDTIEAEGVTHEDFM